MRVLLGQLNANGDCMHATVLARQIKHDHPDAHLTWAISSPCREVLANNPDVDSVWEVKVPSWNDQAAAWGAFETEAFRQLSRERSFDRVILSQVWPSNFQNYDGTVRPSVLRAYGAPITVPVENVLRPTSAEEAKARAFGDAIGLNGFKNRILFECASRSSQSFMTPALAEIVAERLYRLEPDTTVILSSDQVAAPADRRTHSGDTLSIRETAALMRRCSLMVGCGSGISVAILMTGGARPPPSIQILSSTTSAFASVAHDLEYFGQSTDHILETCEQDPDQLALTIARACREGMGELTASARWRAPIRFDYYRTQMELFPLRAQRYLDVCRSLGVLTQRYGWTQDLLDFGRQRLLPNLALDASYAFAPGRLAAEVFRDALDRAPALLQAAPRQGLYQTAENSA